MGGMEFTWRMFATLAWPVVVVIVVIGYKGWITTALRSLRIKLGSAEFELNTKVDDTGREIAGTLSEMPAETAGDSVPTSLVDLMPVVTRNRSQAIRVAFDLVHKALKDNYPQLRRVPASQLTPAMQDLVDRGLMDADVKLSVQRVYELLQMPEWDKDPVGDTRGYAFLMLAEGAIHGILRGAKAQLDEQETGPTKPATTPIPLTWRGSYRDSLPIELSIRTLQEGGRFRGTMSYPDSDTVTSVDGRIDPTADDGTGIPITWKELKYVSPGRRDIEFRGTYQATVSGSKMTGSWRGENGLTGAFDLTALSGNAAVASMAQP
jgi:hypothetical protein